MGEEKTAFKYNMWEHTNSRPRGLQETIIDTHLHPCLLIQLPSPAVPSLIIAIPTIHADRAFRPRKCFFILLLSCNFNELCYCMHPQFDNLTCFHR